MIVLALDTATERIAIGVAEWPGSWRDTSDAPSEPPRIIGEVDLDAPRAAMSRLLPAARDLLAQTGYSPDAVGAIVGGIGPGSFTGVRIGMATAQGLAHALGAPLIGAGTLDAIAWRSAGREGLVGVVGDAMRKEVYPALYRCDGVRAVRLDEHAHQALGARDPYRVTTPRQAAEEWSQLIPADATIALAGNGLHKYADVFIEALGSRAVLVPEALWYPTGSALLMVAWDSRHAWSDTRAADVLPVYTRLSDAEEAEAARDAAASALPGSGVAGPEADR